MAESREGSDRDKLLAENARLREALKEQVATWLTVSPILEAHVYEPNASGYVWNAWTRWGERAAERAESALASDEGQHG
jgi:hypothetical protein